MNTRSILDWAARIAATGSESMDVWQDGRTDTINVNGVLYSREVFRALALITPPGRAFRIIAKDERGTVTVESLDLGAEPGPGYVNQDR